MALMVLDDCVAERLNAERAANGLARHDEVWEGLYVMAPPADTEHQVLQARLTTVIQNAFGLAAPELVMGGANVSDRDEDWLQNYRIPDIVVVLPGSRARDCGAHWCGGPDFCAEIASPGDRNRDKVDFYGSIGVGELLIIDRDPWSLELFRLSGNRLQSVGRSDLNAPATLASTVVPVSFTLQPASPRPRIAVAHRDGQQHWIV